MVATYDVVRLYGASLTEEIITNARFRTDDANDANLVSACIITNTLKRSYWKNLALKFGGTFSEVSNIRIYSAGDITWTLGSAGKVKMGNRDTGDIGCPNASYQQATGTPGDNGNDFESAHSYYSSQTTKSVNLNSIVSGSPKVVDSTKYTSAGRSKHVVLQVEIDGPGGAVQGVQAAKTITFLVDEI